MVSVAPDEKDFTTKKSYTYTLNGRKASKKLGASSHHPAHPAPKTDRMIGYCTKCLSGSLIAGVKIEITTSGSSPVTFVEWTLPIGLK
jgi:hypothetical protein